MTGNHTRERALELLEEWTKSESLRKHGLAVSACTEAYGVTEAARLGMAGDQAAEFVATYACAGLLHDMDYERHPTRQEHPFIGVACESHLDKALFACDELAGFLTACALVKPTKSILDVEVKSVLKKIKDKAFARAVKREDITDGAALLGLGVEEHIANCLAAMQARAPELGLSGN